MRVVRWVAAVLFLVAFVTMAAGCGGASGDSAEPAASAPAETALQLLQRSSTVMASVGSFRARTTIEGTSMGQELVLSLATDVGDNRWTHTRMSIEAPDEVIEIEQVLTGEHAYTRIPSQGPTWLRMDLEALADQTGLPSQSLTDPLGFYNGLFPRDSVPWEAYSVKSAGLRRIYGVKTEHLQVDLDFQEVWAALGPEQRQQLQQSLVLDPNAEELVEQLEYESIDIWIDVSGYVRQLEVAISAEDDTRLEVGMVLTDFREEISIEEPKEYVDVP